MSSINPFFTFSYAQPEEYRFCHDSVFLAREVFERFPMKPNLKVLDLCSGVGVVGLDFLHHLNTSGKDLPEVFDFLEVQSVYKEYFFENAKRIGEIKTKISFININYANLFKKDFHEKYDLILCNPPYFRLGLGILSPSEFKNRCRFFIDSDFKTLFESIDFSLKEDGMAFVLLRDLKDNGIDTLNEAREILKDKRTVKVISEIRGTPLVLIQ